VFFVYLMVVFFFSSRRRHTRSKRDWSSDVCSSDLIPAFCDIVVMVEGNASMYLGSPRMAEKVIGEKVSLEEMGGAKMHCSVSGCGDVLVKSEEEAISFAQKYLS